MSEKDKLFSINVLKIQSSLFIKDAFIKKLVLQPKAEKI